MSIVGKGNMDHNYPIAMSQASMRILQQYLLAGYLLSEHILQIIYLLISPSFIFIIT